MVWSEAFCGLLIRVQHRDLWAAVISCGWEGPVALVGSRFIVWYSETDVVMVSRYVKRWGSRPDLNIPLRLLLHADASKRQEGQSPTPEHKTGGRKRWESP